MPAPLRNLVVISDLHVGCRLGLMHPKGAKVDAGGRATPSPEQLKLWKMWREFWDRWVPRSTHGEPFGVVLNGDAIDGTHHDSTTQWSHNLADQRNHAQEILKPVVELCEGRFWHIRGTEAHVGKSGTEEEQLAKALLEPYGHQQRYSRWELWKRIGSGLVHITHHIGTTSSAQHETSAINAELAAAFTDAGRWNQRPPDIIVRSHRHRCAEVRLPHAGGYATAFVSAAWQLKTPYTYRIPAGRSSQPQIGGSLIRQGDEELHTRHCVWAFDRPEVE